MIPEAAGVVPAATVVPIPLSSAAPVVLAPIVTLSVVKDRYRHASEARGLPAPPVPSCARVRMRRRPASCGSLPMRVGQTTS